MRVVKESLISFASLDCPSVLGGNVWGSVACDANVKQALVATKGGLSPPRSVLKHQDLSPQRSPEGPRKTEGRRNSIATTRLII